jgi:hypothetical protein
MTAVLPLLPLLLLNPNSKLKGHALTLKDHTLMIALF